MRALLFVLSLSLGALVCSGQSAPTDSTATGGCEVTPAQLAKMLGAPKVFVFDCNEEDQYTEAHVPGAKLIVYDQVTGDKLPPDTKARLVFYCYSPECPASRTAAKSAMKLGYTDVCYMLEGITGWQDAGQKTEP